MTNKKCKDCDATFSPTGKNHKRCGPCGKKRAKDLNQIAEKRRYREYYHESVRFSIVKRKYGITKDQFNEMFNNQQGCCAICKQHQSLFNRTLAVDHCHTTGQVRGLLCGQCNLLLGHANDNIEILLSAIAYLQS